MRNNTTTYLQSSVIYNIILSETKLQPKDNTMKFDKHLYRIYNNDSNKFQLQSGARVVEQR